MRRGAPLACCFRIPAVHALTSMHSRYLINACPIFWNTTFKPNKIIISADSVICRHLTHLCIEAASLFPSLMVLMHLPGRCKRDIVFFVILNVPSAFLARATISSVNSLPLFGYSSFHRYYSPEITCNSKATSGLSDVAMQWC